MISGVMSIFLGEAICASVQRLCRWPAVYIPRVEEPGLVKRFGEDYEEYRRNVPRWMPRLRAWNVDDY
jgi:protein-S-isoprenylcysteine O-methyltransferase Ste14